MKILILDIETRPSMAYVWGLWGENIGINQIKEHGEIISWAAKWLGEKEVMFASVHHDGFDVMVRKIHDLLGQADAVVHFNGRRFDIPHLNVEFIRLNLQPPSPFTQIDLMETAKHEFRFISNKLDYIIKRLGIGQKVEHEGFPLWVKCMNDDPVAWEKMKRYNIGDVVQTEKLYKRLLPWIKRHPSHGAFTGDDVCPNCGSKDLQPRGFAFLRTGQYPRFKCGNPKCGKWSRGAKRVSRTGIVEAI